MFRVPVITQLAESVLPLASCLEDVALEIIQPMHGKFRSRTVVSRSRARGTGRYPSWKMGRMIQWESPHELNGFRLLDADPTVKAFHEQPLAIRFTLDGQTHLHHPDLLIEREMGGRELWEITLAREAARSETSTRAQFLQSALPSVGFKYRMVIGEELKREPRLSNALTLLKYGRGPIGDADRERIRQIFQAAPIVRWASAVNGDLGPHGRALLCRLALEGVISFDFDEKLTVMTAFRLTTSGGSSK